MKKTILAICAATAIFSAGIAHARNCFHDDLDEAARRRCIAGDLAGLNNQPSAEEAGWARIKIGMTSADVLRVWVAPDHVNTTVTVYGKREQWVYGRNYLYFEDGHLVAFQRNAR